MFFQYFNFAANIIVFCIAIYIITGLIRRERYLDRKEKDLEKKEGKADADYHNIVDNALLKERQILEDAANEARKIIADTKQINDASKEQISKALGEMFINIQKESTAAAKNFLTGYEDSLKKLSGESLADFQNIASAMNGELQKQHQNIINIQKAAAEKTDEFTSNYQNSIRQLAMVSFEDFQTVITQLKGDFQKQIRDFHEILLPSLQKEIAEYKEERLKQAEQSVNLIIKKVSQTVFNKTLTPQNHKDLIIASLDRARKEGIFD